MTSRFMAWTMLVTLLITKVVNGLPTIDILKELEDYHDSSSISSVSSGDSDLNWFDIREISNVNNRFAVNLYKEIATDSNNENILFSPFSVSNNLAMVYLGARGNTSKQILEVMGLNSLDNLQIHRSFRDLNEVVISSLTKSYSLRSANRIFVMEGVRLSQKFLHDTKEYFNATAENLDFISGKRHARRIINTWVREQTNGKIKNLVERNDLNALTVLVLVNAVYFKADWEQQFKKKDTRQNLFHISDNVSVQVSMMYQAGHFPYGFDNHLMCDVIELPYSGKVLSMVIALPRFIPESTSALDNLERQLTPETFHRWSDITQKERKLDVYLPKFSISEQVQLDSVLKKLGLVDLFDTLKADLSGVCQNYTRELYVSKANHEASIDVNEEGSEATAATAMIMSGRSRGVSLYINRPFLFYIRHNPTDTILFLGRVTRPTTTRRKSTDNNDILASDGTGNTFAAPARRAPAAIEGRRGRSRVGRFHHQP